ncbi:MAG TPA: response regulator transcription factor [Candidatus Omnitrophota bacterium]|nr:response regulator transcription factor [Candidatus Omnitrophota bacterium]
MPEARVLVVEDDPHISKLVKYNFEKAGFSCLTTITGEEALNILDKDSFDLIILDVMLPKMDGFETCRLLKQDRRFAAIPVMILTARGEEVDRVVGLELGADDYIVKPFSPRELVLRAKAVLRRGQPKEGNAKEILSAGDIVVDLPRHKITVHKKVVELSPMEFNLLAVLVERKGRVQSREQLLTDVWGLSSEVTTRTIDTHVKLLRQKLGKIGDKIETVRGIGYKIDDEA